MLVLSFDLGSWCGSPVNSLNNFISEDSWFCPEVHVEFWESVEAKIPAQSDVLVPIPESAYWNRNGP